MLATLLLLWPTLALAADADDDGINNRDDACREEPEVHNGYEDEDGCPDELGTMVVAVKTLAGEPVAGARVTVSDNDAITGAEGEATFADLLPGWTYGVTVRADAFLPQQVQNVVPVEGRFEQVVTLDWLPVPVRVRAVDAVSEAPLDAAVRLDGPGLVSPGRTGESGETVVKLRPGDWRVTVYADHYLEQTRELTLTPEARVRVESFALEPSYRAFPELELPFATGSREPAPEARERLDRLARDLFGWPELRVDLLGHPDPGAAALAERRAGAVRDALVAAGVDAERLEAGGGQRHAWGHPAAQAWARGVALEVEAPVQVVLPGDPTPVTPADVEAERIAFGPGEDALDPVGQATVEMVAAVLAEQPEWRLRLVGQEDASDFPLARARAVAIREALVARGVAAERLVPRPAPRDASAAGAVTLSIVDPDAPVELPATFWFAAGDSLPLEASEPFLAEAADLLRTRPGSRFRLLGHSEPTEPGGEAPDLSRRRAEAVARALEAGGVDARRLDLVGLGARYPLPLPEGLHDPSLHRRVHLLVLPPTLLVGERIVFPPGARELDAAGRAAVERAAAVLASQPTVQVRVVAHAGEADGPDAPLLAERRAGLVRSTLSELGVDARRVRAVGTGTPGAGEGWVELDVSSVDLAPRISFEPGEVALGPRARVALAEVRDLLLAIPAVEVSVTGTAAPDEPVDAAPPAGPGTDPREALALARARAVADHLGASGIPEDRLSTAVDLSADGLPAAILTVTTASR